MHPMLQQRFDLFGYFLKNILLHLAVSKHEQIKIQKL